MKCCKTRSKKKDPEGNYNRKDEEKYSRKNGYISYSQSTDFKFLSFSWMTKWISMGCKGKLKPEEYPSLPDSDFDQFTAMEFGSYMNQRRNSDGSGFLERVVGRTRLSIMKVFRHSLIWLIVFTALRDIFEVINVYLLQRIMKQDLPKDSGAILNYIVLAFIVCLVQLLDIFIDGHHHFIVIESRIITKDYVEEDTNDQVTRERMKRRGGIAKFFDNSDRNGSTLSNVEDDLSVMNLALFDITEVAWGILKLVHLMTVPLKIIIVGTWLYSQVATTAIKGICFILMVTVLMLLAECQSARMIKRYVHRMDLRIFKTQTILEDLRNLRLLRWIPLAIDSIINSRIHELQICLKRTYLTAIGSWLGSSLPKMLALAVFLISIAEYGVSLDPSFSIPLLHTLNYFIRPFKEIPSDISDHLETTVSCNRVESFIYRKELDCHIKTRYDELSKRKVVNGVRVQKKWYKQILKSLVSHSPKTRSRTRLLFGRFRKRKNILRINSTADVIENVGAKRQATYESTILLPIDYKIINKRMESVLDNEWKTGDIKKRLTIEKDWEDCHYCEDYPFVVKLDNATFCRSGKVNLKNISLTLEIGQIAMIIGPCGSGKSSLIQAIMGSCTLYSGRCIVPPLEFSLPIGYVGQNPWISAGSVREIILFGHEYNECLYSHVVKTVELDIDFKSWDKGDFRRVDEGGQNLSTGQRVRISLARTIYNMKITAYENVVKNADETREFYSFHEKYTLYCLDDVFSVLDPSLCTRVFNRLFGPFGMLKDASTILVVQPNFFALVNGSFAQEGQFFIYSMNDGSMELTSKSISEYLETHGNVSSRMSASGVSSCDYMYGITIDGVCNSYGASSNDELSEVESIVSLETPLGKNDNVPEIVQYFSIEDDKCLTQSDDQSIDAQRIDSDASFLLSCISSNISIDDSITFPEDSDAFTKTIEAGKKSVVYREDSPRISQVSTASALLSARIGTDVIRETSVKCKEFCHKSHEDELIKVTSSDFKVLSFGSGSVKQESFIYKDESCVNDDECIEKCARGAIKVENFAWYLKKVDLKLVVLLLMISTIAMTLDVGGEMVITQWTALGKKKVCTEPIIQPNHPDGIETVQDENTEKKLNHLYTFTFLTSATIVLFLWRSLIEAQGTLNAAHKVYESALKGILNCSVSQLNKTPIGSINNKLSTDQSYVDYSIFRRFSQTSSTIIFVILTAISLCYLSMWVIPIMPILILLSYTLVFRNYIPMCMENMRATLQSRSSLVSVLSQTINGANVVRTSKREEYTMELFLSKLYTHQKTKLFSYASGSWTIIRLRFIAYPLILINILMPIVPLIYRIIVYGVIDDVREKIVSPDVGLALTYSMKFAKLLKTTLSRMVELESEMCASQRLQELARMSPEYRIEDERIFSLKRTSPKVSSLKQLGERKGVTVIDLSVDYDADLETEKKSRHKTSLEKINFVAEACQMIGIVGRTGAGKSTLLLALSGSLPFSGRILLDDVDIQQVEDVDDYVGNIPHTPPLLAGWTVRDCVDPYGKYSDEAIWNALEACSVDGFVKGIAAKFNGGQQQRDLQVGIKKSWESMCTDDSSIVVSDSYLQYLNLARLYLKREKLRLVLIDEAAYVENEMVPMHVLLKEHFSHCTIFIVAHHTESLTLCDRVLILDQGRLVGESKAPETLNV
ncbi:ABC transporter, ATP-binding protein domain containing protein [Theileria equi strain WA]|uniref:ABC transporter, ATP-binding protein domain containing protein n=1 Tax=Theileria equi strain WA TaxID=1537102 RepID=L1LBD5_THEEQ|nr:ABC transporter, ATP-binding protein domain containing protein [Theileria equi strain WA]EKX72478.1 ABC transporter, ATP-binding protein domain containing protein [Theileria equi strain WA]|eukprot:XP_004831930.1 ABC transporter, ATP-binding protein domain containing protein [Theileria equi strain WA]